MARRRAELDFPSVSIEGALFPGDFLGRIAHLSAPEQAESDYRIPKKLHLRDELGRYFRIAEGLWQDFQSGAGVKGRDARRVTVEAFLLPFFRQVLGFEDVVPAGTIERDGRRFPIGHAALGGRVPLVLASRDEELDEPSERYGDEHRRRSPFLLAQEYLNAGAGAIWALVSNGRVLRLLRDNPSLTRPAYVEFDLERLFEERLYPDFAVLWLTCHSSRLGAVGAPPSDCALERWRSVAQQEGTRARERLRFGVADALRELGTGFLATPGNAALRERISKGELTSEAFYQQLLRLIYRLLFLFTVEERGLLHLAGSSKEAVDLYTGGYSLSHLRALAAKRRRFDRHHDLWQALLVTFAGLAKGEPALALPGLGGLFRAGECPDLDTAGVPNRSLLQAIYGLVFFVEDGALVRVNYRDMGPEELGSIYEALLELVPEIDTASHPWRFRFVGDDAPAGDAAVAGNARKLTGSYYTPDSLVQELIKTALVPVIEQRLHGVDDAEKALLSIRVLDPACGSGHFLLAAARKLAEHLAKVRATGRDPRPEDYRRALRDVVSHCIFGVDRNPLALELARTALWLESFSPRRPLGFLDHHLRCGDALLGVLNPEILTEGVPDAAFKALSGDDKEITRELAKKNAAARKNLAKEKERLAAMQELAIYEAEGGRILDAMPEDSVEEVEAKRQAFEQAYRTAERGKAQRLADCYVAAFLVSKTKENKDVVPTTEDLHRILRDVTPRSGVAEAAETASREAQAFHWHREFADVMQAGGFDVLLGNPPWERIKLQEEEFFAARSPEIANARNKAERARLIERLKDGGFAEKTLYEAFVTARRTAEAASMYARHSGRFPLAGVGDVNTYALFAETFTQLTHNSGRAGVIVPTGLATDDTTKEFFGQLVVQQRLVSLFSLYEVRRWFPGTDDRKPFCLLTIGQSVAAQFTFDAQTIEDLYDEQKRYSLSAEDFRRLNPNTLTLPTFRSRKDAELTRKIYSLNPVLIRESEELAGNVNEWGIRFMAMFHMSGDSDLFLSELGQGKLPLYEAKMIHQFDHRWATYTIHGTETDVADVPVDTKRDPAFRVVPRYWVDAREVYLRTADLPKGFLSALRDRSSPAIVLAVIHLLFGKWLAIRGKRTSQQAMEVLYPEWVAFARSVPLAKAIAPTQLGLCGDSGPSLAPKGTHYLPSVPVDDIEETDREKTAWYEAQASSISAMQEMAVRYVPGATSIPPLRKEADAIAFAEVCLEKATPEWFMGWRDIARATDLRTLIAGLIPRAAVGDKFLLMTPAVSQQLTAALLGCLNSLVCDYVARQKVGGTSFKYFTMRQIAVVRRGAYTERDLAFIVPRVLELTYTADDLTPWARKLGYLGAPYVFDKERCALLRGELDAYYAKLYGLTRDELRYILDPADVMGVGYPSETFRVLKQAEEREFGEYRTRRLVLEAWDRLERGDLAAAPRVARFALPPTQSTDSLAAGVWARPMSDERAESGAVLGAILKAMTRPIPARQMRLAATLALQPRLLKPYLTAAEASTWQRLIGPEADPLPQGTSAVIPKADGAWGAAVRTLRTNGSLVEETRTAMWAPGANLDALETAGWPDGRARFVLTVLERQATEAIVRELPASLRDWIDAKAA